MNLLQLLRELHTVRIRFVIVGGVAGQLHGSARLTNDVDLLVDRSPANLTALAERLQAWDAYVREVEPGLPITVDARLFATMEILTLTTRLGNVDVLQRIAGLGTYDDALPQTQTFDVGGISVAALSLDALIDAKVASDRPKNREHVVELRALRDLAAQQAGALDARDEGEGSAPNKGDG